MSKNGWNRSTEKSVEVKKGANPAVLKGLVAGIVVVLLGVLVLVLMSGREEPNQPEEEKGPGRIKSVAPAQGPTNAVAVKPLEKPREMTNEERLMQGRDTNLWKYVKNPITGEEYVSRIFRPTAMWETKPLYQNQALNEIDGIIFSDMADELIGLTIDDRFMKNLQQAFIDGVELSKDDDEETRARKLAMKDELDELKAALKRGEDIQAIIKDALHEHRKVAAFKDQMKEERRMMRENGATEQEVEDFEDACNKLLAEKGASPMITKRSAREKFRALAEQRQGLQEGNQK